MAQEVDHSLECRGNVDLKHVLEHNAGKSLGNKNKNTRSFAEGIHDFMSKLDLKSWEDLQGDDVLWTLLMGEMASGMELKGVGVGVPPLMPRPIDAVPEPPGLAIAHHVATPTFVERQVGEEPAVPNLEVQPSSAASDLSFPSDDWSLASETSTPITPMEMLPKFKRLSHDDQLPPGVTTLMVQDIPRGYTKDQLLSRWAGDGINFFHFPLNSRHKHNARYAFVNFRSNACAADFLRRRQAEVLPSEGEQRGLSIVVATNQGLQHQLTNLRHKRFDGRHRSNVTTWYDNSHVDRWTNSASPWPYVVTGWGYPHGQYATFR